MSSRVYDILPRLDLIAEAAAGNGALGAVTVNGKTTSSVGDKSRVNLGVAGELLDGEESVSLTVSAVLLKPDGSPDRGVLKVRLYQRIPVNDNGDPIRPISVVDKDFNSETFEFDASFEGDQQRSVAATITLM